MELAQSSATTGDARTTDPILSCPPMIVEDQITFDVMNRLFPFSPTSEAVSLARHHGGPWIETTGSNIDPGWHASTTLHGSQSPQLSQLCGSMAVHIEAVMVLLHYLSFIAHF